MTSEGLTGFDGLIEKETGDFERLTGVVELEPWTIPGNINIVENTLTWHQSDDDKRGATRPGMLVDFINLSEKEPSDVLSFARTWGVLQLCQHGHPASHNRYGERQGNWCQPTRREPLHRWHQYARRARAVLNISSSMVQGELGAKEDWRALSNRVDTVEGLSRDERGGVIRDEINITWLRAANVRPALRWHADGFRLDLSGYGFFGALSGQLALAAGQATEFYVCSGCHKTYRRVGRRPQAGRNNFCDACAGDGKAYWRLAQRKHRQQRTTT